MLPNTDKHIYPALVKVYLVTRLKPHTRTRARTHTQCPVHRQTNKQPASCMRRVTYLSAPM